MSFRALSAFAALMLGACAQQPTHPRMDDDPTLACLQSLGASAELNPLNAKVGDIASAPSATISQLADRGRPDEGERVLLEKWGSGRLACVEQGRAFRSRYAPPGYAAIFEDTQSTLISLTAQLYAREISYGEFNIARNRNAAMHDVKMDEAAHRHASEVAARVRAAQLFTAPAQPTTTNCYRLGNSVQCTTR